MARYIRVPFVTTAAELVTLGVNYLRSKVLGWQPYDAELDYILLQTNSQLAAEVATLASDVPDAIFRYYGATMINLPPEDATPAVAYSTWTAVDNSGYTVPDGTVVGVPISGDQLALFEVMAPVVIPPGSLSTVVGEVALQAVMPGADSAGLGAAASPVTLVDPLDWVDTITLTGPTTGGTDAETNSEYLDRLVSVLQTMTPRPILPQDFSILSRNVAGVQRSLAIDGYDPDYNSLTPNEASMETDATGWVSALNATLTRSIAFSLDGIASLSIAAAAAGDVIARAPTANFGTGAKTAVPGELWSARVDVRAATTVRSVRAEIRFVDSTGAQVGLSQGTATPDSATAWTTYTVSGIAPVGTAYAQVRIYVIAAANGEVHYADRIALRRGASLAWKAGGSAELNNERIVTLASLDANGAPVSAPVKAELQAYLEALRETNFIVHVVDPMIASVDVAFSAKAYLGFDPVDVRAVAIQTLQDYLSPKNWGVPVDNDTSVWLATSVVRYLELAQVLNQVRGLDYITSLQIGYTGALLQSQDLILPGYFSLPSASTVVGTIS